ncbi:hypothetical protein CMI37_01880 [Candidatus Pacearchaeota archaeon]|nr:hypothetical protein [Candidatus Pacearchaeota archaeon]|tara:strand:- start:2131 stop:2544 length:414 start_codon:yes stop_codon:yes gene_type:complete
MVKRKKKKNNNDEPTQFLKIKVKKKKVKVGEEEKYTYKRVKIGYSRYRKELVPTTSREGTRGFEWRVVRGKRARAIYAKEIKSVKKVPIYKEKKEIQITSPALREAARKRLQLPKLKKYRKYLVPEKRVRIRIGKKR